MQQDDLRQNFIAFQIYLRSEGLIENCFPEFPAHMSSQLRLFQIMAFAGRQVYLEWKLETCRKSRWKNGSRNYYEIEQNISWNKEIVFTLFIYSDNVNHLKRILLAKNCQTNGNYKNGLIISNYLLSGKYMCNAQQMG